VGEKTEVLGGWYLGGRRETLGGKPPTRRDGKRRRGISTKKVTKFIGRKTDKNRPTRVTKLVQSTYKHYSTGTDEEMDEKLSGIGLGGEEL